jgi:hypothetical protein
MCDCAFQPVRDVLSKKLSYQLVSKSIVEAIRRRETWQLDTWQLDSYYSMLIMIHEDNLRCFFLFCFFFHSNLEGKIWGMPKCGHSVPLEEVAELVDTEFKCKKCL